MSNRRSGGAPTAFEAAAVILDGGRARRMGGAHKAFLEVDGRPIAERLLAVLRPRVVEIVAATSRPEPWRALGVRAIADGWSDAGPLAGIAAGLEAVRSPLVLVVAGDMPHVATDLVEHLLARARAEPDRPIVPRRRGRPEPLLAVWPRSVAPAVEAALRAGRRRPAELLEELPTAWIDDEELATVAGAVRSFEDVDAPADLARTEDGPETTGGGDARDPER